MARKDNTDKFCKLEKKKKFTILKNVCFDKALSTEIFNNNKKINSKRRGHVIAD